MAECFLWPQAQWLSRTSCGERREDVVLFTSFDSSIRWQLKLWVKVHKRSVWSDVPFPVLRALSRGAYLQCWQYQGPVYGSIYDPTDVVGLAVGTAKWAKKATEKSWQICFSFLNMWRIIQFSQLYVENYTVFSICGELFNVLNMWRIIQFSQHVENYSVFSIICGELNLRLPFARTGGKWQVDNPSFLREPVLPQSTVASHRPGRLVWEFNSQQLPAKHREDMSKWEFKSQLQIRIVSSVQKEKTRMTWEEGDRSENGPIQGNWPDLRILEVSLPWFTSIYLDLLQFTSNIDFKVLDLIGEGSFGRVFRGVHRETGASVALKLIPKVGHTFWISFWYLPPRALQVAYRFWISFNMHN